MMEKKNPTFIEDEVFIGNLIIHSGTGEYGKGAYTAASTITQNVPPYSLGWESQAEEHRGLDERKLEDKRLANVNQSGIFPPSST